MRTFRPDVRRSTGNGNPFDLIEGILLDDLEAASDVLVGATTATIQLIKWDAGEVFYNSELEDTITNRSIDLAIESGTYVIAARLNGEWRIIWADCTPSGGGGSGGGGTTTTTGGGGVYGSTPYGGGGGTYGF